ncbi:MAG: ring-cleaving dioxygenase [bacterium]|nr:ring-cleaving dioxygenase [bacterium]
MIKGIHHITAIASDPKKTVDFYTRVLGLRLVKKSVNQDDVATYHLFFGDKTGEPGMDLTFFTFQPARPGSRGVGQVTTISFAVPSKSLVFWQERFAKMDVKAEPIREEFGQQRMVFYDHDNQRLELVELENTTKNQSNNIWTAAEITTAEAIISFYSARLMVEKIELVAPILEMIFGYTEQQKKNDLTVYTLENEHRASVLEVEERSLESIGQPGAGTVHHIAFRVDDEAEAVKLQSMIIKLGLYPTEVINRFYFKSVYFRSPAGILFEIATDGPGFATDETEDSLGEKLALPPFLEDRRAEIEAHLSPIK